MIERRIRTREEWKAAASRSPLVLIPLPVSTVFVHTSVTDQLEPNATPTKEAEQMRRVQQVAFGRKFSDFSYSFGVFPSGRVYQGRGRDKAQAATEGFNSTSLSICTIGNTDIHPPTEDQLEAIVWLINHLQEAQAINPTHVDVRGHREVAPKACPGRLFTDAMITDIQQRVNHS